MATRIRQKAEKRAANKDNRPYAVAKDIRMSSSKVRIVLSQIRGKKANEAVALLAYMPQAGAAESLKVLKSAIANAENNKGLSADNLYVAECYATFPWEILLFLRNCLFWSLVILISAGNSSVNSY